MGFGLVLKASVWYHSVFTDKYIQLLSNLPNTWIASSQGGTVDAYANIPVTSNLNQTRQSATTMDFIGTKTYKIVSIVVALCLIFLTYN